MWEWIVENIVPLTVGGVVVAFSVAAWDGTKLLFDWFIEGPARERRHLWTSIYALQAKLDAETSKEGE